VDSIEGWRYCVEVKEEGEEGLELDWEFSLQVLGWTYLVGEGRPGG